MPRTGRYFLAVRFGGGPYDVTLEAYRPAAETAAPGTVQTIFLDFDGARVNTAAFADCGCFGSGCDCGARDLSPLSAFLPRWGLTAGDESAVVAAVTATVIENVVADPKATGTNPDVAVRIADSGGGTDLSGRQDVSRVVIGGGATESGLDILATAQSTDPGNFAREETALVQLDRLSAPAGKPDSLATYLATGSDRIGFLGRAIGNLVSQQIGRMVGSWATAADDRVPNLMDRVEVGTAGIADLAGVGPDRIGGTADDVDVDFGQDAYSPYDLHSGVQDTLNRTAWAFRRGVDSSSPPGTSASPAGSSTEGA